MTHTPTGLKCPVCDKIKYSIKIDPQTNLPNPAQPIPTMKRVNDNTYEVIITSLFHITNVDNVSSILRNGIFAKNECIRRNIKYVSIADKDVQGKRGNKIDMFGFSSDLHDYVPLFFGIRTPMLYSLRTLWWSIVYLVIRAEDVLRKHNTIFTDRNAAASSVQFYRGQEDLENLDWPIISGLESRWKNIDELGRAIRGAEVLVHKNVEPTHFTHIVVYGENCEQRIKNILEKMDMNIPVHRISGYYNGQ